MCISRGKESYAFQRASGTRCERWRVPSLWYTTPSRTVSPLRQSGSLGTPPVLEAAVSGDDRILEFGRAGGFVPQGATTSSRRGRLGKMARVGVDFAKIAQGAPEAI